MLGLWLALLGLSASERLHHLLHADAAQPDHDCLVVGFSKGSAFEVPVTASLMVPTSWVSFLFIPEPASFSQRLDLRLLPGRAPPSFRVLL